MSFSSWLYFWEKGLPLAAVSVDGNVYSVNNFYALKKHYRNNSTLGVVCGPRTGIIGLSIESALGRFFLSEASGNYCPTTLCWNSNGIDFMIFNDLDAPESNFALPGAFMIYYQDVFLPLPRMNDVIINRPLSITECPQWLSELANSAYKDNGSKFYSKTLSWANQNLIRSEAKMEIKKLHQSYVVDNLLTGEKDIEALSSFVSMLLRLGYKVKEDFVYASTLRR